MEPPRFIRVRRCSTYCAMWLLVGGSVGCVGAVPAAHYQVPARSSVEIGGSLHDETSPCLQVADTAFTFGDTSDTSMTSQEDTSGSSTEHSVQTTTGHTAEDTTSDTPSNVLTVTVPNSEPTDSSSAEPVVLEPQNPLVRCRPQADAGKASVASGLRGDVDARNSSDLDGDILGFRWRLMTGPGTVLIDDPFEAKTDVEFEVPGQYVFQVEVSDGLMSDTAEVLVLAEDGSAESSTQFVIHISLDGLRPDVVDAHGPKGTPWLHKLREEGASTHEARTAPTATVTVPNHISQLTGRLIAGERGHNYISNVSYPDSTLHLNKGEYVASIFDVVHDGGGRTAYFSGKTKLNVIHQSYTLNAGAEDSHGENNGRRKLDRVLVETNVEQLLAEFILDSSTVPYTYSFLHILEPDQTGHSRGWNGDPNSDYGQAVAYADSLVGRVVEAVEDSAVLRNRTLLVVTADHGGVGSLHDAFEVYENFRIPVYVWGPNVEAGADLYDLNPEKTHPGVTNPGPSVLGEGGERGQPIRHCEVANLAASELSLPPIPGSTVGAINPLNVRSDEDRTRN